MGDARQDGRSPLCSNIHRQLSFNVHSAALTKAVQRHSSTKPLPNKTYHFATTTNHFSSVAAQHHTKTAKPNPGFHYLTCCFLDLDEYDLQGGYLFLRTTLLTVVVVVVSRVVPPVCHQPHRTRVKPVSGTPPVSIHVSTPTASSLLPVSHSRTLKIRHLKLHPVKSHHFVDKSSGG